MKPIKITEWISKYDETNVIRTDIEHIVLTFDLYDALPKKNEITWNKKMLYLVLVQTINKLNIIPRVSDILIFRLKV